jgi:hypothetical protein
MMIKNKKKEETDREKDRNQNDPQDNNHVGSSNAFAETEDPLSRDPDNISDEKLDELLGE